MDGIQYTSWNPILTCLKRIADLYVSFGMLSKMDAGKLLILSLKVICVISYSIHHIVFLKSLILDKSLTMLMNKIRPQRYIVINNFAFEMTF